MPISAIIYVLGVPVRVILQDEVISDDKDCMGEWFESTNTIKIRNQGDLSLTLWHELMHAVIDILHIKQAVKKQETLCNTVAALVCSVTKDARNDEAFKLLEKEYNNAR